jgi:hypothetical protein
MLFKTGLEGGSFYVRETYDFGSWGPVSLVFIAWLIFFIAFFLVPEDAYFTCEADPQGVCHYRVLGSFFQTKKDVTIPIQDIQSVNILRETDKIYAVYLTLKNESKMRLISGSGTRQRAEKFVDQLEGFLSKPSEKALKYVDTISDLLLIGFTVLSVCLIILLWRTGNVQESYFHKEKQTLRLKYKYLFGLSRWEKVLPLWSIQSIELLPGEDDETKCRVTAVLNTGHEIYLHSRDVGNGEQIKAKLDTYLAV